jgi:hypothetical protein
VVVRLPGADIVGPLEHLLVVLGDAVEEGHLVEEALRAAFGAGAVVPGDVDDEGVLQLARLADRLDDAADVVVGLLQVAGVHLHEPGEELLLLVVEGAPSLDLLGPLGQLRVLRDHAQLLLLGERRLADVVPPLVELALVLVHPLLFRWCGAWVAPGA